MTQQALVEAVVEWRTKQQGDLTALWQQRAAKLQEELATLQLKYTMNSHAGAQRILTNVMLGMLNADLSAGFLAWRTAWRVENNQASDRKRAEEQCRRVGSRMLNRELSRGWSAWAEAAAESAATMQKLRKGLSYMVNRHRALGFASWRESIAPKDDPMSRAVLFFVNRELGRGWTAWKSTWQELAAKRAGGLTIDTLDVVGELLEVLEPHPHDEAADDRATMEYLYSGKEFYDDINGKLLEKDMAIEARRLELEFFPEDGRLHQGSSISGRLGQSHYDKMD